MASTNSTVDGMGFEEVNQSVTSTDTISGTNVYATDGVYADYISGTTIIGQEISGTNVYATTNVVGDRLWGDEFISGLLIKGTTISGTNIINNEGELQSVSVGSGTAVYGAKIQAGSGVLASNDAWITFPVAYAGLPTIVTQNNTALDSELLLSLGSLNVGSFHMTGTNASDKFNWMAVGV